MRPWNARNRRTTRQRGASAVDMAVTLPFVLLAIFMVIECGNLFNAYLTVQKASQMGARFAVSGKGELEGTRLTSIKSEASELLNTLPSSTKSVAVRSWEGLSASGSGRTDNPGAPCDTVEVSTSYQYVPATPMVGVIFQGLVITGLDRKLNEPWNPCK